MNDIITRLLIARTNVENGKEPMDLNQLIGELEADLVDKALAVTHGNRKQAAALLGIKRTTLVEKLRKRGMLLPWNQWVAKQKAV